MKIKYFILIFMILYFLVGCNNQSENREKRYYEDYDFYSLKGINELSDLKNRLEYYEVINDSITYYTNGRPVLLFTSASLGSSVSFFDEKSSKWMNRGNLLLSYKSHFVIVSPNENEYLLVKTSLDFEPISKIQTNSIIPNNGKSSFISNYYMEFKKVNGKYFGIKKSREQFKILEGEAKTDSFNDFFDLYEKSDLPMSDTIKFSNMFSNKIEFLEFSVNKYY